MSQDPHDQLLLQIRGVVAEYERVLIAERMRCGRTAKLRAGALLPWTRPPYGYRLDPERPRDPAGVRLDAAEAAVVAEIFAWYAQEGHGLRSVVRRLEQMGVPSPSGKKLWGLATLRGVLTNPTYTGQVYVGRTRSRQLRIRRSATHPIGRLNESRIPVPEDEWIAVAQVPAVVTPEQFALAKAKLAQTRSFATRNNKTNQYLLRALVSCGRCLMACRAWHVQPHNPYYICGGKARPFPWLPEQYCPSRYVPAGQLDEMVWRDLCELLTQPETIAPGLERAHGGNWLPQELQADVQSRLTQLTASVEDFCRRARGGLAGASFEQRRQLVELLIDRVVVTDDQVEIRYVIPTGQAGGKTRFCRLRSD